jgi:cytochrome c peroxidase
MLRCLTMIGLAPIVMITAVSACNAEQDTVESVEAAQIASAFDAPVSGSNGRSCGTCHAANDGWGLAATTAQNVVNTAGFSHPLFRNVDANRFVDDDGLADPAGSYKWLLERGLIRVNLPLPSENADFFLAAVGPETADWVNQRGQIAVFRRPLPTTNLKFNRAFMWDGRETVLSPDFEGQLNESLRRQAFDATKGHAEAPWDSPDNPRFAGTLANIVGFERAQFSDPVLRDFCLPQLPTFACRQSGRFFAPGAGFDMPLPPDAARGRDVFVGRPFVISDVPVAGVDGASFAIRQVGTCATCHNGRNVGSNTDWHLMDVGVSRKELANPERPLYVFRNKNTGEERQTTDPGRALISGRWSDMDCFKVPSLREVRKRAPYFHDGSAQSLEAVVNHYEDRFQMNLNGQERADLLAFLGAL